MKAIKDGERDSPLTVIIEFKCQVVSFILIKK